MLPVVEASALVVYYHRVQSQYLIMNVCISSARPSGTWYQVLRRAMQYLLYMYSDHLVCFGYHKMVLLATIHINTWVNQIKSNE